VTDSKSKAQEKKEEKAGKKLFAALGASKFAGKYIVLDDSSGSLALAGVEDSKKDAEEFAGRLASKRNYGADSTPVRLYVVHVPQPEAEGPFPTNPKNADESNEPEKPSDIAFAKEQNK